VAVFKPDRATQQLLESAGRARARGAHERAAELVRKAADALVEQNKTDEAIDLCVAERDYAKAAEIAERTKDWPRAAQFWFRGGELAKAAKARVECNEPMIAAELYERAGDAARAAEIYERLEDYVRASALFEKAGDKHHAADLLVRALSAETSRRVTGPEADEVTRRAGVLYAEVGLLDLAVRVLRFGGQNVFAGQLLARAGRIDEAIATFTQGGDYLAAADLARAAGNEKRRSALLGERSEKEGRVLEAALHYEQAEAFLLAARSFEYSGESARAAECYERGGQLDSAAELYEQLGRMEDAARCLRTGGREVRAAIIGDDIGRPREDAIRAWVAAGEYVLAADALIAMARAGDRPRYQEAAMLITRVGQDRPDYMRARMLLAEVLSDQGDHRTAITVLHDLLASVEPHLEHVAAFYQYGRLLEMEGYLAGARNAYRVASSLDPSFRDAAERMQILRETDGAIPPPAPVRTVTGVPVQVPDLGSRSGKAGPPMDASRSHPIATEILGGGPPRVLLQQQAQVPTAPMFAGAPVLQPPPAPQAPPEVEARTGPISSPTSEVESVLDGVKKLESEDEDEARRPARPSSLQGVVLRSRFRIEKKVGRGAQAEVYRARDLVLDRPVAIKVLNEVVAEDSAALDRFLREARLAARVHHAACIAIFDFGQERGITFMAMEYFKGKTLRERLNKSPVDLALALRISMQVAEALGAVHQAGIVHRDVKPTNIMVDDQGAARLTDFGVAKTSADDGGASSPPGQMVGTMKYMSPEQARGKDSDGRSDIFSLGVMMFEMLAGKAPFGGTLDDLIRRVTEEPPRLPPEIDVPEALRDIVQRCMQRKPAARYQTVDTLIADLKSASSLLERAQRSSAMTAADADKAAAGAPSSPENVPTIDLSRRPTS
jgi:tetratricopeptide (TPR) repeat protein/tRNA A-37 threonylcarbamoyl transferase component Bud32